jgi:hypothetical protein
MTSTKDGVLSNLGVSASTTGIGQALGRMVGTENQSNRDVLKSTRLQLLNAIKQATGMGAGQLNSNVELQTWLSSLGGEGMTKEANLEILDKIRNKYLKGSSLDTTLKAPASNFSFSNPQDVKAAIGSKITRDQARAILLDMKSRGIEIK